MIEYLSTNVINTEKFASQIALKLLPGDIIAFKGSMGVGKTAFVRGLAKGLLVEGDVSSPTFSIIQAYYGKINLYHFDMYRINTLTDLYSTGFFDYLDEQQIIAVEWSENILDFISNYITISFEILDENTRKIKVEKEGRF